MLASVTFLQQGNVKISKKLMKIVNIAEENLHIFGTSGEIPIKYSGNVSLMIILKIGTQLPPPPPTSRLRGKDFIVIERFLVNLKMFLDIILYINQ